MCTSFSFQTLALNCSPQNRDCFPQKFPQCEARPPCQLSFWAHRLAVTEPEVPVLCAAVRLGFDTGQRDQNYANRNQMGRESPVDYRRRREACVFVYSCGDLGPRSFFPFHPPPPLSVKQIEAAMSVVCTHSQLMTWHIFYCQSVGVSLAWSNKYKRLIWCLDLGLFQRRLLWHTVNFLIWSSKGPSLKMKLELKWARKNKHRVKTSERPLRNVSNQIDDETFGLTYLHDK